MNIFKAMKCTVFHITENCIIGGNVDLSVISYVSVPTGLSKQYEINYNLLVDIGNELSNMAVEKSSEYVEYMINERANKTGFRVLMDTYNRIMCYLYPFQVPSYYIEDLRKNEDFNEIMKKKAADGAIQWKVNGDIFFIYPSLLGLVKSDKVRMKMYRCPGINIAEFIINKKFMEIHKYIGFLPLQ